MHWDVQSKVNAAISIRIDGILFVWLKWIGIFFADSRVLFIPMIKNLKIYCANARVHATTGFAIAGIHRHEPKINFSKYSTHWI